jgi:nucleoside diphosphate kinase/GNAT superfamily N-acetyltransferase
MKEKSDVSERTLVLVKPDGVNRGLVGEVISRIERKGLKLAALELRAVDRELATQHYAEHDGKPFFGSLVEFITSTPVVAMVVEGTRSRRQPPEPFGEISAWKSSSTWCTVRILWTPPLARSNSGSRICEPMTTIAADTAAPNLGTEVQGPTLVENMTPGLVDEIAALLISIARVAELVDFDQWIDEHRARAEAVRLVAEAAERRSRMVVMTTGTRILGLAMIEPTSRACRSHRGNLTWFMLDPDFRSVGLGRRLLDGAVHIARVLGTEQLYVNARVGSGMPEFYQRRGWTKVGQFPGGWRLDGVGDYDEVWYFLQINPPHNPTEND